MTQYIGRVSGKHFTVGDDGVSVEDQMKVCALQFAADQGLDSWCFVFEMGSINEEPHMHFYFRSAKSLSTLQRALKSSFSLPKQVSFALLTAKSIHICFAVMSFIAVISLCLQSYSLKVADPSKLESYFVYLAKGVNGKRGDRVAVWESIPRLWAELHEQYHSVAEERREAHRREGPQDFYHELAAKCVAERKTSKEDVLAEVVRHYVEDGKKGFSKFQVEATFGRVFSLVNGGAALEFYYAVASSSLFRV